MSDPVPPRPKLTAAQQALLEQRLRGQARAVDEIRLAPRADRTAPPPLSFAQQRLWFLDRFESGGGTYNMPAALRLTGPLDTDALERSLNEIIRRHEILRTTFGGGAEQPVQIIAPALALTLRRVDMTNRPATERADQVRRLVNEEANAPFDLTRGPLLRAVLYQLAPEEQVLSVTFHHIVSDGWSSAIFWRELAEVYGAFRHGRPSPLSPLPLQYADFSVWQRRWLQGPVLEKQLAYWKKQLQGSAPLIELPADRPRPAVPTHRGGVERISLPPELTAALKNLGRQHDATLYMVLLAAFQTLLHRCARQEDILVGSVVAGRNQGETEGLIGFFVNTLVLRADCGGDPGFAEFLKRVRETALGAFDHQDLPFEKLVEELKPARNQSHHPFFQTMFAFQDGGGMEQRLDGLQVSPWPVERDTAKFDLGLELNETAGGLRGFIEYSSDLFDAATIARLRGHFETLLQGIVEDPQRRLSELPLLTEAGRRQVLAQWNHTARPYEAAHRLHQLIEQQVARTPEAVALEFEGQELTYAEMNRRANQLARLLRRRGVGPDVLVGVFAERSFEMVVAMLAVLKAGGAYVPLDPSYPAERLGHMLEDARTPVVLAQPDLAGRLPSGTAEVLVLEPSGAAYANEAGGNLEDAGSPRDLAYVIFTSGSTGRPKGAMNEHHGICNQLLWMQEEYGLTSQDRLLQKTPFSFDASVWEFFLPLLAGARVVIARPEGHRDSAYLVEAIRAGGITTLQLVPSMLRVLLEETGFEACGSLRRVFCGGEALPHELQERFFARLAGAELHNLYGPAETAVQVTSWTCQRGDDRRTVPIGRPVANTQIYVLDARMQPVPPGVAGELYVGGEQVGRGYVGREDLTRERFVPDPFSSAPTARLYRTGDLARHLANGAIEYLGRLDFQAKIRGQRIELGEIEAILDQHPAVGQSVVMAREDSPGDQRLVAYVVARQETPAAAELKEHLSRDLPAYMVPGAFVFLEALPLTASGKVDRKALPAPEHPGEQAAYVAPRTPTEKILAGIWAKVLKLERVGVEDNFFELGGHSLLAVSVIASMRRAGLSADVRALFANPTLAGLAAAVGGTSDLVEVPPNLIPPGGDAITPEMLPLVTLTPEEIARVVTAVPGGAAHIQDIYPLGPLQEGILFHHLLAAEGDPYLLFSLISFDTRARLDAYLQALQAVIDRHDILRTAILWEGLPEPVQVVWRTARLEVEEVSLDAAAGDVAKQLHARFDPRRYRIDVRKAPLLRVCIAHDAAQGRWVAMQFDHHLVGDHTTQEVMKEEIQLHLLGRAGELPAPLPFRNYIAQVRLGVPRAEHEKFFRKLLGDVDEPTAPFGLTDVQGDGSGIVEARRAVDASLARRLRTCARSLGVNAASLVHLAWAQVLAKVSGREDVVFGTLLFGRMQGGEGAERVLGLFINTLPVRIRLGEETVLDRVRQTHAQLVELLRHEHAPLSLAQRCSTVAPATPLFSALLNYRHSAASTQPAAEARQAWEGIQYLFGEERTNYPLVLSVDDMDEDFRLNAQVQAPLDPQRVCALMHTALERLVGALESAPATPVHQLEVLPPEERKQVLEDWNNTATSYPREKCIHELFEEQAARTPGTVAVVFGERQLTYAKLNEKSSRLAHRLREFGVGPDVLVGLCVERSLEMIVGLLAILKAGGAYVPLDSGYPAERLAFMFSDARMPVLLTQTSLLPKLPAHNAQVICLDSTEGSSGRAENFPSGATADSLAYVIYTSGSTGQPKGAAIPHRGVTRLVKETNYASFSADEVFLQMAPVSFDASTFEIWGALLNGARLVVAPPGQLSLADIGQTIRLHQVTTLWLTAGLFHLMVDERLDDLRPLRQLLAGGDVLSVTHVQKAARALTGCRIINGYGPTESTTFTCCHTVVPGDLDSGSIPIGRPIANTTVFILDRRMQPVPVGVPGELWIGGDGLARGYLNRPELTAEKFVPNPFSTRPGARLYKTGDLVRHRRDGTIEFLGRLDNQVKIRGFRIEPGEIEAVLNRDPRVGKSLVIVREDRPGDKQLVAYVVPNGASVNAHDLRQHLEARLPAYMVPAACVLVESFPLTANGKVDRRALPAPAATGPEDASIHDIPVNPLAYNITEIWKELLGRPRVGQKDNFFEIGGHSLLAVKMMERVGKFCGRQLPVSILFHNATIEKLAVALAQAEYDNPRPLLEIQTGGTQTPLFFLHGDLAGGGFYCSNLARLLGPDQPFFVLTPLTSTREVADGIEAMARHHLKILQAHTPHGPYRLAGYCAGGLVALEMARQLQAQGETVEIVALIDTATHAKDIKLARLTINLLGRLCGRGIEDRIRWLMKVAPHLAHMEKMTGLGPRLDYIMGKIRKRRRASAQAGGPGPDDAFAWLTFSSYVWTIAGYRLKPCPVPIALFWSSEKLDDSKAALARWRRKYPQLEIHLITGGHLSSITQHVGDLADSIRNRFKRISAR